MRRADRLFEIIQMLRRASAPLTAEAIAATLEVSERTIYRDMAALLAMRVPVAGEAGIGYIMRPGYDLPPLNFDHEELEAIQVGLSLLIRTGDRSLNQAAARVLAKIERIGEVEGLRVSDWGVSPIERIDLAELRAAVREERKLALCYRTGAGAVTERRVWPIAITYHTEVVVMTGWCELRSDFRSFRGDRIERVDLLEESFKGEGAALRARWEASRSLATE